jgi:copper homeostasis protein
MDAMLADIEIFKGLGADGFVFGALTEDEIDQENCKKVIANCGNLPVTFHRAFDMTNDKKLQENIRIISEMGFSRILTSGLEPDAEKGIERIKKIVKYAKECNIEVVPGAGITLDNCEEILRETECKEFHASARRKFIPLKPSRNIAPGGSEDLEPLMICDSEIVKELIKISKTIKQ